MNRDFHADAPNEKWVTDISEFQIPAGKVYLSPMIDCFDGMVVSWTIGTSPDAELVNTMLDAAIETVTEDDETPIVHSDRGGHLRFKGSLQHLMFMTRVVDLSVLLLVLSIEGFYAVCNSVRLRRHRVHAPYTG
jgi:hypothetical protein